MEVACQTVAEQAELKLKQALEQLADLQKVNSQKESELQQLRAHARTLSSKLHRVTLQKQQLQEENYEYLQESETWTFEKMQLECKSQLLTMERKQDLKQIEALQCQLKEQQVQFQQEIATVKKKSAKLVSGLLPRRQTDDLADTVGDQGFCEPDPKVKATLECNDDAVQQQVLDVLAKLYSSELTEDQAVQQLAGMQFNIFLDGASMGQTSTEAIITTPVQQQDTTPATSPSRQQPSGSPLPALSPRLQSVTKTCENDGKWNFYTQFVLAEPSKLQRLIERAAATKAQTKNQSLAAAVMFGSTPLNKDPMTASRPGTGLLSSGMSLEHHHHEQEAGRTAIDKAANTVASCLMNLSLGHSRLSAPAAETVEPVQTKSSVASNKPHIAATTAGSFHVTHQRKAVKDDQTGHIFTVVPSLKMSPNSPARAASGPVSFSIMQGPAALSDDFCSFAQEVQVAGRK